MWTVFPVDRNSEGEVFLFNRKFRWNFLLNKKALRANDAHSREEVLSVYIRQRQSLSLVVKITTVTSAFGLAHSHARRNVDSAPATSRTTTAPLWLLLAWA